MKRCTRCKEVKSFDKFSHDWHASDGWKHWCNACLAERMRDYRRRNPGKIAVITARAYQKRKSTKQHKETVRKAYVRWAEKSPKYLFYMTVKHALRRKPAKNPITVDYLMQLWRDQNGICAISGMEMTWRRGSLQPTSISVDRIDHTRGYEIGNVRLVAYQVNTFRGRWSDYQMLAMARAIVAKADAESEEPTWHSSVYYDFFRSPVQ